ncbi:MAG: hypothetical protein EP346_10980 [Bacteroidetes bacterium]|nr:MAG: hypothetical protein EP346_10980 [Bacteroidota bacterium]
MSERLFPIAFLRQFVAVFVFTTILLAPESGKAQCTTPGPGEVAIEIVFKADGFGTEVSWNLQDSATGNLYASVGSGSYNSNNVYGPTALPQHQLCLPTNQTLKLNAFDSFGDGWNGGTFYARYAETQDTAFSYTLTTGSTGVAYFQVEPVLKKVSICQGESSPALVIDDTIALDSGQYIYSWEESFDRATWAAAPSWNGDPYSYQPLGSRTDTSYYRRIAIDSAASDTIIDEINLIVPDSLLIDSVLIDSSFCAGVDDGSITLYISGGAPPYSYSWSDNSTAGNRTGLAPGIYSVVVSDQTGCMDSITVEVAAVAPFEANIAIDDSLLCYSDTLAALSLTGFTANANITYLWSTGDTTQSIDSLTAGTYWGRATDTSTGCIASDTITLVQPDTLVIDSIVLNNNVSCYGGSDGSVTVYHTGGTGVVTYTFTGLNTSVVLNDPNALIADDYTVLVTDENGCTSVNTVNITVGNDRQELDGGSIGN